MVRQHRNISALTGLKVIVMAVLTALTGVEVSGQVPAGKDPAVTADGAIADTVVTGGNAVADTVVADGSAVADSMVTTNQEVKDTVAAKMPVKAGQKIHSPKKATIFSAVLPGLGQIYNRKYWKAPLVYIGLASLIYSIDWNNDYYVLYRQAYADIVDQDPTSNSFKDLDIEGNWDFDNPNQVQQFTTRLEKAKESSRRYRDLCIIGAAAFYAINIIDATVDAHLFNFDISDDLTMNWVPQPVYAMDQTLMGVHFVISF